MGNIIAYHQNLLKPLKPYKIYAATSLLLSKEKLRCSDLLRSPRSFQTVEVTWQPDVPAG